MARSKSNIREHLAGGDPGLDRTVRVAIPARVAFDLGSMQKVTASILDRLGCPQCHSGWDIRFDLERQFLVDEKLNVNSIGNIARGQF